MKEVGSMFIIFLSLSILIFTGSLLYSYVKRREQTKALTICFMGVLVATGFLVFPLFKEKDQITNLINTVFYAVKITGMSGDFTILKQAPLDLYPFFKYTLYLYSVLAPVLAASVIVTFIGRKMDEFRSKRKTKKTVHIFSEVNERAILLAETLKQKNNKIIMCNIKDAKEYHDRIKQQDGIILRKGMQDLDLEKYQGEIKIYALANDQNLNLKRTLELIEMYKNSSLNITIYLFSVEEEAQIILDSTDKGKIKTIITNEIEQMAYQVLDEMPLYQNVSDGKINVLIVGAGKIGMTFLKAISWCGQLIGYDLEIHVVDQYAEQRKQELLWQCPELKQPNYAIYFHQFDVNTASFKEMLEQYKKRISYVIVALGEDNQNLKTAVALRRYFLREKKEPLIGVAIENIEKKKQIQKLKNERGSSYNLYAFGGLEDLYGKKNILNEKIENLAKKVHLAYNPADQNLEQYYKIEYYKKSSRALALHMKYKIYMIMKTEQATISQLKEKLSQKEIRDQLAQNEHDRWNAYMRADGYQTVSLEEVMAYEKIVHHHVYHLAKMHPGLIEFEKLDDLSKEIEKIEGRKVDFKKSDYDIIDAMPEILKEKSRKE